MINKSKLLDITHRNGTPLIVVDHEIIRDNFKKFSKLLPRVKPYYAIKANPESEIVNTLYKMGSGFDVASWEEFMIIYDVIKGNREKKKRFMNENVIYANPVKRIDSIKKLNNYYLQISTTH